MQHLGYYVGISRQTEVLLLTLVGIWYTIFDASLLELNSNVHKVWDLTMDPRTITGSSQIYLKYVLSMIVLVRSFSVHLYLAFYVVMLWPAIFEDRPALLLPWLIIGAIKCLGMDAISFIIGMYTCVSYGIDRPACLDFLLAQIIDHGPSVYMWFCVLGYYRELKSYTTLIDSELTKSDFESELTMRRRKVRSMADDIIFKHHCPIDEDRHLISVSTIENIVQQLTTDLHRKTTRSLDSLLGAMVAEAEKEELMNICDDLPSEETGLSIQEKTQKLLKLTEIDITEARKSRLANNYIFTTSMLAINNILVKPDEKLQIPTKIAKLSSMKPKCKKSTSSEQNTNKKNNLVNVPVTNFMADISETEIGGIRSYSSASLLKKNQTAVVSARRAGIDTTNEVVNKGRDQVQQNSIVKNKNKTNANSLSAQNSGRSDFSCQASTLSRNVLHSPPSEFENYMHSRFKPLSKKLHFSSKTLRDYPYSHVNIDNSGGVSNKVMTNTIKEMLPVKVDVPKNISSFKTDGYIAAYNERLRSIETTGKNT